MSGLYRGKIEMAVGAGNRNAQAQVAFKNLYDFFSSHPNYTMIALQYGLTGTNVPGSTTSGTGTGYYDGANSFGYNAFFVVRANATTVRPFDVYYLFQWGGSTGATTYFGASPGNPGTILSSTTSYTGGDVGMQCAIGIGGTGGSGGSVNSGNPWKGTMNGNGLDTKPTTGPIWGAPTSGTGVIIFPRSNTGSTGIGVGSFISRTQNCSVLFSRNTDTSNPYRLNVVADDDSFCIFNDLVDNGNYALVAYCGLYNQRVNVSQLNSYPFCCLMPYAALPLTFTSETVYGDLAGTSVNQGGIVSTLSGTTCSMQLDHLVNNFMVDANHWPDHQIPGGAYNEFPISVGIFENSPVQISGYMGQIDWIREMYNTPTNDTKSDFSRIFIGSTTLAQSKISVPWDSQTNTVPRSGASRAGVTFVTTT